MCLYGEGTMSNQRAGPVHHDAATSEHQAGMLALLGLCTGSCLGWLLASGSLPWPSWLPLQQIGQFWLVAGLGIASAFTAGLVGWLFDISSTLIHLATACDDETTPRTIP